MQNLVTKGGELLNEQGLLNFKGYSKKPLLEFNPENTRVFPIKFLNKLRLKQWDYYGVMSKNNFFSVTISHLGYASFFFVYFIDFDKKEIFEDAILIPFSNNAKLGKTSNDDSFFISKNAIAKFIKNEKSNEREIYLKWPNFKNKGIYAHLVITEPEQDSIVMMTPIKKRHYYYNQKINCLPVMGAVRFGNSEYKYNHDNAMATLDWGRGVWEYSSFWNWASASWFLKNGSHLGLNLGCGFGDLSYATENCFFYNGKMTKLDKVYFNYDNTDFMKPWFFGSNDSRLNLTFTPIFERVGKSNALVLYSEVHQIFGIYKGYLIDDNNKVIEVSDVMGWAEEHKARW